MGEVVNEGMQVGGEDFGLDQYDFTQENVLRQLYREDYRDFTRSIGSIYSDAETDRAKFSNQVGKSGFAGSGMQSMYPSNPQVDLLCQHILQ